MEDVAENETRFAWLAREPGDERGGHGPWKTSLVFWGVGAEAPGWLVSCLSELAFRGVNMTRIESRPRKQGLGRYMFFVDVEGRDDDPRWRRRSRRCARRQSGSACSAPTRPHSGLERAGAPLNCRASHAY